MTWRTGKNWKNRPKSVEMHPFETPVPKPEHQGCLDPDHTEMVSGPDRHCTYSLVDEMAQWRSAKKDFRTPLQKIPDAPFMIQSNGSRH